MCGGRGRTGVRTDQWGILMGAGGEDDRRGIAEVPRSQAGGWDGGIQEDASVVCQTHDHDSCRNCDTRS
eukprot:6130280-Alexandrium_andersonii.AAC.1